MPPLSERDELDALERRYGNSAPGPSSRQVSPQVPAGFTLPGGVLSAKPTEREELAALTLRYDPAATTPEAKAARAQVFKEQAERESPGTRLAIGTTNALERLTKGVGGVVGTLGTGATPEALASLTNRVTGATPEQRRAAREGAGALGTVGDVGADVAMTALPAGRLATGLGAGAGSPLRHALAAQAAANAAVAGATTPGGVTERGISAGLGAAGGALGEAGGRALVAAGTPSARTAAARGMLKDDVPLTPGQYVGGALNQLEALVEKIPFLGTGVREARRDAERAWQQRLLARVNPEKKVPISDAGHATVEQVAANFDRAYDRLLHQTRLTIAPEYFAEQQQVLNAARAALTDAERRQVKETFAGIYRNLYRGGPIPGTLQRQLEKNLERAATEAYREGSGTLGNIYADGAARLRGARDNALGQGAAPLRELDDAYSQFKIIQRAASKAEGGVFTPQQLVTAARQRQSEAARGRGTAPMLTEAEAAKDVLAAPRVGWPGTLGGLGALGYGGFAHPGIAAGTLASTFAPPVGRVLTKSMAMLGRGSEAVAPRIAPALPPAFRAAGQQYPGDLNNE